MLRPAPHPHPQPLTGARSSRCATVLATCRGPGRVQRSRRKATCVPGRSLPPIPPRRGGLRSPHHLAHHCTATCTHPVRPRGTPGSPARCGGPQKLSGPPPWDRGFFPRWGAERTTSGKPEPRQQLLYSAVWGAWGAVVGGSTGCLVGDGGPFCHLALRKRESRVSTHSLAPLPPLLLPGPPLHAPWAPRPGGGSRGSDAGTATPAISLLPPPVRRRRGR